MALGRDLKNIATIPYQWGRRFTDGLRLSKPTGLAIDAIGGAAMTYWSATGLVGNTLAVAGAVAVIATAPVSAVPALAGTIAIGTVMGLLSLASVTFGLGMLAGASKKSGLSGLLAGPKASVELAAARAGRQVARPFKWTARTLRQPFKKAHDGRKISKKAPKPGPKAGSYKI